MPESQTWTPRPGSAARYLLLAMTTHPQSSAELKQRQPELLRTEQFKAASHRLEQAGYITIQRAARPCRYSLTDVGVEAQQRCSCALTQALARALVCVRSFGQTTVELVREYQRLHGQSLSAESLSAHLLALRQRGLTGYSTRTHWLTDAGRAAQRNALVLLGAGAAQP